MNAIYDIVLKKINNESLSQLEQVEFEKWIQNQNNFKEFAKLLKLHKGIELALDTKTIDSNKIWTSIGYHTQLKPKRIYLVFKYAAIFLLPLAILFTLLKYSTEPQANKLAQSKIKAGERGAELVLSDGSSLKLTDTIKYVTDGKLTIQHKQGNSLVYAPSTKELKYNCIKTYKGQEYKLTLSDGTEVWLNAESSLKYPINFIGNKREVYIKGEGYFKVAKNKKKPFIVHSLYGKTKVLGTEFNVKCYKNQDNTLTTLVEGSVLVNNASMQKQIQPGEQACMNNQNQIKIKQVDINQVIAWKKGYFYFKKQSLEYILDELARWYNFKVFYYNTQVKNYVFSAKINRKQNFSTVIQKLEYTNKIKVEIQDNTIIIMEK